MLVHLGPASLCFDILPRLPLQTFLQPQNAESPQLFWEIENEGKKLEVFGSARKCALVVHASVRLHVLVCVCNTSRHYTSTHADSRTRTHARTRARTHAPAGGGVSASGADGGLLLYRPRPPPFLPEPSEPPAQCPIYALPGFMNDAECDALLALARRRRESGRLGHSVAPEDEGLLPEECAALAAFEQRISLVTGGAAADPRPVFKRDTAESGARLDSSDEEDLGPTEEHRACRAPGLPHGLHVDTHNSQRRRYASVILYLNSIAPGCGGETVFPHASRDAAALLQANVTHTHSASRRGSDVAIARAARSLLSKAQAVCDATHGGGPRERQTSIDRRVHVRRCGDAMAVCPSKGLCLLFYTRHVLTQGQVSASVPCRMRALFLPLLLHSFSAPPASDCKQRCLQSLLEVVALLGPGARGLKARKRSFSCTRARSLPLALCARTGRRPVMARWRQGGRRP